MPLETFKTQVLLLHSEQSTLDELCKGFNDRYTVHCATSGSEALSTLGQVPIHVIVSAQRLPGMSRPVNSSIVIRRPKATCFAVHGLSSRTRRWTLPSTRTPSMLIPACYA